MKVKCLHVSNGEVPVLIEKYGYHAESLLYITRKHEYTVYGMIYCAEDMSLPTLSYIIRDDLGSISRYPAMLFEVTDNRLTDVEWYVDFFKEVNGFRLRPGEFAKNLEEYEMVVGSGEPDRSLYDIWCDMIDKIEAERETT